MRPIDIYAVVYKTVTKESMRTGCEAVEGHKRFAQTLPSPRTVSDEDAAVLSAMVCCTPSNDWGLEGFFQTHLESGETLGQFVRKNLAEHMKYVPKMESVARKYRGLGR